LKSQLTIKSCENEGLQQQVVKLISDNQMFEERIQKFELKAQNSGECWRREAAAAEEEMIRKNEDVEKLKIEINEKQLTIDRLCRDFDRVQNKNGRLTSQAEKNQSEMDGLLARLLSSEASLNKRHFEVREVQERYKELDERYKSKILHLERDLNSKNDDIAFFKTQLDMYTQDFTIERAEASRLREQNENYKQIISEKEQFILRLTTPISDHNKSHHT